MQTIFSWTAPSCNGVLPLGKIFLHPIQLRLWCSLPSSNADLASLNFLCRLLDHYQIELIHLNPNSILQIAIFVHLCETFLGISPKFPLFKNYFFLKYYPSATNRKVIGGVGLQTHPHTGFIDPPLKTSIQGWARDMALLREP
jgi:hypothetical protein